MSTDQGTRSREKLFAAKGDDFVSMPGATHEDFKIVIELITSIHRNDKRYKIRILYKDGKKEFTYNNRRGRCKPLWGLSTAKYWGSNLLEMLRDPDYRSRLISK